MILEGIFAVDVESYKQRVRDAAARIESFGWGSQRICADACDIQPTRLSRIIRGIEVDESLLYKIECWIYAEYQLRYPQAASA